MIFRIERSSDYGNYEKKPCENAYEVNEEVLYESKWRIEINTLEDLMNLQKEVNKELVLGIEDSQPFIEIYDCWREWGG